MIMEVLVSPVYFQGVASCKKFIGKNSKKSNFWKQVNKIYLTGLLNILFTYYFVDYRYCCHRHYNFL